MLDVTLINLQKKYLHERRVSVHCEHIVHITTAISDRIEF